MVAFGTLLLIIPGIIALVGFIFAQYLIAEEKTGIFESFKESWKMTRGNRWKIFWLMIVLVFFNIFGALALVIGLFITIPMSYLMYAHLYRTLNTDQSLAEDDLSEESDMEVIEVVEGNQTQDSE